MFYVGAENSVSGGFSNSVGITKYASRALEQPHLKIHALRLGNVRVSVMIRSDVIEHKMQHQDTI